MYFKKNSNEHKLNKKKQINKNKRSTTKFRLNNKIILNSWYLKTIKFNKSLNYKNLEFFTINKVINNNVYQLNLFESISEVFSVFYL